MHDQEGVALSERLAEDVLQFPGGRVGAEAHHSTATCRLRDLAAVRPAVCGREVRVGAAAAAAGGQAASELLVGAGELGASEGRPAPAARERKVGSGVVDGAGGTLGGVSGEDCQHSGKEVP